MKYLIKFKADPSYYVCTADKLRSLKKRFLACSFLIQCGLVNGIEGETLDKYNPKPLDSIPEFKPAKPIQSLDDFF